MESKKQTKDICTGDTAHAATRMAIDEVNIARDGKRSRFFYLFSAALRDLIPRDITIRKCTRLLNEANSDSRIAEIRDRVDYYNKLSEFKSLSADSQLISEHRRGKIGEVYYFDAQEYLRFFKGDLRWRFIPGDVTIIPDQPTIVKSRPILGGNSNAVLMNLNKIRHFIFVHDRLCWEEKSDKAVFRGKVYAKKKRLDFFERHFGNPACDLGDTSYNPNVPKKWFGARMTIREQLRNKFILSIEGNDVASNLKWIMSSNSIAVMPRPVYETWFMEGRLVPGVHYIEIKSDYSDLSEKLDYYKNNPEEAKKIICAAHRYVERFQDRHVENLVSLMVMDKYFRMTNTGC